MTDVKIALVGGTGLADALGASTDGKRHEIHTPFGATSDAIIETNWDGVSVFTLSRHGPGHLLNPSSVPYRANIFALKQLGVTHVIASGAVGSLREEMRPKDLVIPDQLIDKTSKRAGTFFEKAAVHVEFAEPFCPVLRQILMEVGSGFRIQGSEKKEPEPSSTEPRTLNPEPFKIHDRGCYVCMEGPAFSTRAESLMHRLWGGDLIGMTVCPEAKLAKEAEMSYALVALVTDFDCWRAGKEKVDEQTLLAEIIGNLKSAGDNAIALMRSAVSLMAGRQDQLRQCPAQHALKLAIWSDKSKIAPEEIQRLGPLWQKYF